MDRWSLFDCWYWFRHVFCWMLKHILNILYINGKVLIFFLLEFFKVNKMFFIVPRLKLSYFQSRLDVDKAAKSIVTSCVFGIAWPIMPLLGWSRYSLEGDLTSCSIEWAERSFNVISYNMTILVFVLIIPVSIIIYCDIKLILKVFFLTNKNCFA